MRWKFVVTVMILCMAAAVAWAAQDGQPGLGADQQPVDSFIGTLEREGEDFVLNAQERTYGLELMNGEQAEEMVGQEVEVRGWVDGDTIHAEAIGTTFDVQVGPLAPEGAEQPMAGQEANQSIDHLGPDGAAAPGVHEQNSGGNRTDQPMAGQEGHQTGQ